MNARTARKLAREKVALERVKAGASSDDLATELNLSPKIAAALWRRLAKSIGIKVPKRQSPRVEPDYVAMLVECERHLGRAYVARFLGPKVDAYDEGQVLKLQQLHAALRFELLDAGHEIRAVRERLRELNAAALNNLIESRREA